jgi:hypothetical protein
LGRLVSALAKTSKVPEDEFDVVLSIVHKAKGREWRTVKLEDDFRHPDSKMYFR